MSLSASHITGALKAAGANGGQILSHEAIANLFNEAMIRFGDGQFDTPNKVAALVSESMMESAFFRTTEEYNTTRGDYQPYRGRTFIQITWKDNYAEFGKWCFNKGLVSDPNYFVKNPTRLEDLKWATVGPVWYFTQKRFHGKPLTAYANSIGQVGKAVNLGDPFSRYVPNGWRAREDAYRAVRAQGSGIVPRVTVVTDTQVEKDTKYKESIMAIGDRIKLWNNTNQPLKFGEQYVHPKKSSKTDVTVATGPSTGVQVRADIEIDNPGGYPIHGFWRVVDWTANGETTEKENNIGIPAVGNGRQVITTTFNSELGKPSGPKRSMRLRLIVRVGKLPLVAGQPVPRMPSINNVHIDGWKI